ncbi:sulfatase-like hydrolase/transferase [Rhizobium sp. CG5]|uniref:sulfatase-like hydrolase/transferase n=1 Tax=Rhizobium sp. CG5 TaxID=2726076 RepID=UPI0020338A3C|nr:sulfatase-like hydrolase/transferase [Rhizobium sp. CG5]
MKDWRKPVSGWKGALSVALFAVIGFASCTMPDNPDAFHLLAFWRLPIELPLVALALLLLPRWLAVPLAVLATFVIFCLLFLKLGDIGVLSAFQRRFNPYLDMKMLLDGWNVLSGAVGKLGAGLAIGLAAGAIATLMAAFCWSCLQMTRLGRGAQRAAAAGFAILLALGFGLATAGSRAGLADIAELRVAPYLRERLSLVARSIADIRVFEAELAARPGYAGGEGLFGRIKGRDVILVFIESYGRSAIEDPRYGGLVRPRLETLERQLQSAGYSTASGWARSPTVGGLSWLAHGTLLSGLWVDSQARYDLLMKSQRTSLNRLFGDAGWQTAAIMPAITMDWPESAYFGYDRVLAAKDLGYRGKSFNWVTMPDQYTLSAFERLALEPARKDGKPVMAEIALISSHAPWTPVPKLIDWQTVGDGTVFNVQADSGDPPEVVWADPDRVRRHYAETIDYTLQTLGDYIARFGRDAVFVVLGDHQPAALVTGPDASRAVPIHIVSRDAALVEGFVTEGFATGMIPDPAAPEPSMADMRESLIRGFSAR